MRLFQVLDEENQMIAEYSDLDYALSNAETLTLWHSEHYYHVEEIELMEH